MKSRYNVDVGLSDHTLDNTTAIAAIALGAVMIENMLLSIEKPVGPTTVFS